MIQSFDLVTQRWKKMPFRFGNFLIERHRESFPNYAPIDKKYKQLSLFFEIEPTDVLKDKEKEVLAENFFFFN